MVLKISELQNKRQPHNTIEIAQSRYFNETVTLIVRLSKCSYRRVIKKAAQLQSIHPIERLARVKSSSRQFSYSKTTLHMVHLEPVTVQLHSRQPVDSSVRVRI